MNPRDDKYHLELLCHTHYPQSADMIEARGYKSVAAIGYDLQYTIDILKQHGALVRKFQWSPRKEISSSDLFKILSTLPHLEEIDINCEQFLIEIPTPALDLSHIKTLHCSSEPSFEFFSMLLPANCLKELNMMYGRDLQVDKRNVDRFAQFISNQTSIKAFSTDRNLLLSALSLLTIDKLELGYFIDQTELIKVLRQQPTLKQFSFENDVTEEVFEEVCKLSMLESLELYVEEIKDGQNLGKLKNLKKLKLHHVKPVNQYKFFTFQLESLEVLSLDDNSPVHNAEILEAISINLPSLKRLKLSTTQKLNLFAKIFTNLEELDIDAYGGWEMDTGIVNEDLRKLSILTYDFCHMRELFFEIFKIYPNLKSLKVDSTNTVQCEISHHHFTDGNFFAKINKLEKLECIELRDLRLEIEENNLMQIAEELKKAARKFKRVKIRFSDYYENGMLEPLYDSFLNDLRNFYEIDEVVSNAQERCYSFMFEIYCEMSE